MHQIRLTGWIKPSSTVTFTTVVLSNLQSTCVVVQFTLLIFYYLVVTQYFVREEEKMSGRMKKRESFHLVRKLLTDAQRHSVFRVNGESFSGLRFIEQSKEAASSQIVRDASFDNSSHYSTLRKIGHIV
ncbi:hypothetical protein KQX54_018677 [Cotesia glomerata]|uniref:Uncharacterized protein n=1 Tax=Cotesia glomerata TaxID=32391 RepID=A0AAV7IGT8_COTGL|nr:hypothetical protein KQX54_018677 [Cotesia glomerata]